MAITPLPYPGMDFVPLDILTAAEMDQIVANYEAINNATIGTGAIADSAITNAKIADGTITSDKIDIANFAPFKYTNEEQAIGVWIDGKTIYRRAFSFTTGSAIRTNTVICAPITGLTRVIHMYGSFLHAGGDDPQYAIIHAGNPYGTTYEFISFAYSGTVGFHEYHNYTYANSQSAYGVIEYIK